MVKKIFSLILLVIVVAAPATSASAEHVVSKAAQVDTDVYSLIAEVNALRAANGLPAYSISPILMSIAQQHAEFMSVNGVSHTGYGGTRPYQRALNAGYPLAGDLSLGGFISENITAGNNKSAQRAVLEWQGDAPHLHTMLSSDLQEIGAGVAYVGDYVYYVIDCARPTGSGQPQHTPVPGATQGPGISLPGPPLARTIVPNTPNPDGKLVHIVGPGETLWLIAISYGVKIAEIRALNYMTETEAIYPGDKLLIRKNTDVTPSNTPRETFTPTALVQASPTGTYPTDTPALSVTPTPKEPGQAELGQAEGMSQGVTSTLEPLPTQISPSDVPAAPVSPDSSMMAIGMIVLAALVLGWILARTGRQAG